MKDKKKLIIMVCLGAVVLGIGAFQFVGGSSEPAKTAAKQELKSAKTEETKADGQSDPAMQQLYAVGMSPRDPFQEGNLPLADGAVQPPAQSASQPAKPNPIHHSPSLPPFRLSGQLPGAEPGGVGLQPERPIRRPGEFQVTGVITGAKPAAVFVDENGNQRLVTVGGSLDGDSQLVSVEKGKVTIRHKGKEQTLTVGGTPNVK